MNVRDDRHDTCHRAYGGIGYVEHRAKQGCRQEGQHVRIELADACQSEHALFVYGAVLGASA